MALALGILWSVGGPAGRDNLASMTLTEGIMLLSAVFLIGGWVGLGLGHHRAIPAAVGAVAVLVAAAGVVHLFGLGIERASGRTPRPLVIAAPLLSVLLSASWLLAPAAIGFVGGRFLHRAVAGGWSIIWKRALRRARRARSVA